jgi:tetratricopeptide (TPR) repeat protein
MNDFQKQILNTLSDDERDIVMRYTTAERMGVSFYMDSSELEVVIDFFLCTDDNERAQKALDRAWAINANSPALLFRKAQLVKDTSPSEAIAILDSVIVKEFDPDCIHLKAKILFEQMRFDDGDWIISELSQQVDPSQCAYLLYDTGAFLLTFYRQLQQQRPTDISNVNKYYELAEHYFNEGNKKESSIEDVLNFAEIACELNCFEISKALYNHAIDLDAYNMSAWEEYGMMLLWSGAHAEALDAFNNRQLLGDCDLTVGIARGECLLALGRYQEALDCYTALSETFVDNTSTLLTKKFGECYQMLERYDQAMAIYEELLQSIPEDIDVHIGMAYCYTNMDAYRQAIVSLHRAISLLSEDDSQTVAVDLYKLLGDNYSYCGSEADNIQKADDYCNKALSAYIMAEAALLNIEPDIDNMNEMYTEKIVAIWVNMGNIYLQLSEYENAIEYYVKARNQKLDIDNIHVLLMVCYFKAGLYAKAIEQFTQMDVSEYAMFQSFIKILPELEQFLAHTQKQVMTADKKRTQNKNRRSKKG